MWIKYNPNPERKNVGDCTVRAISKAMDIDWETTFTGLVVQGYMLHDMPSANHVWGAFLKKNGFEKRIIPNTCPDCYTVKDFCEDHKDGVYVLALGSHVVTVQDGCYFDSWDSGDEVPLYYFARRDE